MNNINPKLWGPPCWKFLHYVTIAYPDYPTPQDKENVKSFFYSLGGVLPCENCQHHFAKNFEKYPLSDKVLSCRYNLVNWLIDIHNDVNARNGKKIWSYDEVMDLYTKDNNMNFTINCMTVGLIVLIIVILLVYLYIKIAK